MKVHQEAWSITGKHTTLVWMVCGTALNRNSGFYVTSEGRIVNDTPLCYDDAMDLYLKRIWGM